MRADMPEPGGSRRRFGLFRKGPKRPKPSKRPGAGAKPDRDTTRQIEEFLSTRKGVEAYVEPPTPTHSLSVVLVAADGEWIRKAIPDAAWLQKVSRIARLPVYDASLMGYPKRMRDYKRPGGNPES